VKDQRLELVTLSLEELVLSSMRNNQLYGVIDFPRFKNNRVWHKFVYHINQDAKDGKLALRLLDVDFYWIGLDPMIFDRGNLLSGLDFALEMTTLSGRTPNRMRLDTAEESWWGKELDHFSDLAKDIFELSLEIGGFIEVG
jgi:hypothetical protein